MATERQSLLNLVVDVLDSRRVPCALIGAAALAVHGISRATFDIDLLVTDAFVDRHVTRLPSNARHLGAHCATLDDSLSLVQMAICFQFLVR